MLLLSVVRAAEFAAAYTVRTANDLNADLIVTITDAGRSARFIAKYRPRVGVLCVTQNANTAANLLVTKAAIPFVVENLTELSTTDLVARAFQRALDLNIVRPGSLAVLLTGTEGKQTLTVKVLTVPKAATPPVGK